MKFDSTQSDQFDPSHTHKPHELDDERLIQDGFSRLPEPTPPTETQTTRIAALEAQLEEYRIRVHDLETNCDPAGNLQQIASLKEQVGGLLNRLKETNNGFLSIEDASVATCSHCGFKYDPQNATTGCPMCQTMSIGNWAPTKAHIMMSALCNCELMPNEHEVCEHPVAAPTERVETTGFDDSGYTFHFLCNECLEDPCECKEDEGSMENIEAARIEMHAWCTNCDEIQPARFDGYIYLDISKKFLGGDISCNKCHFIISTLYKPKAEATNV